MQLLSYHLFLVLAFRSLCVAFQSSEHCLLTSYWMMQYSQTFGPLSLGYKIYSATFPYHLCGPHPLVGITLLSDFLKMMFWDSPGWQAGGTFFTMPRLSHLMERSLFLFLLSIRQIPVFWQLNIPFHVSHTYESM